ncbi:Aste57867_1600 [Aphanomyces stellatus]|uniref:Aste57867_1600 protein n=1 Tax=Aphanomyces stellatus TaxID=120398 RepID=A0A485K9T6_9STRA|nr:hypothetical protein As57867_001599 [Aphanomyces stellatus]VFT78813.1 Aste57867_1600 [Aphanomyces stellatus]
MRRIYGRLNVAMPAEMCVADLCILQERKEASQYQSAREIQAPIVAVRKEDLKCSGWIMTERVTVFTIRGIEGKTFVLDGQRRIVARRQLEEENASCNGEKQFYFPDMVPVNHVGEAINSDAINFEMPRS